MNGKYLQRVLRITHILGKYLSTYFLQEEEPIDFIDHDTPNEDKSSILLKDEDNM